MGRISFFMRTAALASAAAGAVRSMGAPVTAADVVSYNAGSTTSTFTSTPTAATGQLNGNTGFGGLNPFNPPFSPGDIIQVNDGGSITLHLSSAIPTNGINLGVYANAGIVDSSQDGSGQADPTAVYFGQSRAKVSVSQDGVTYYALNGGAPVLFTMPTNYYTDTAISGGFQPLGTVHASQSKPFLGGPSSFNGQTYAQMKATLNNSAGGTWLDLRGTPVYSVNYVKFDVAPGTGDHLNLDAIGGMGAANTLSSATSRVISEDVGGGGTNTSHIVVDFGPQSYDFIVHYNGSITGEDAMNLLAANSDFRFGVKSFSFGDQLTSLDYGGYFDSGDGSVNGNFWKYFVGDGSTWNSASAGFSSRTLSNGSYDGWVWNPAQATAPDFAAVPEPATGLLAAVGGLVLLRRRRRSTGSSVG